MIELVLGLTLICLGVITLGAVRWLTCHCPPSQVLVIAGAQRSGGGRTVGYRLVRSGSTLRVPWLESIHRLDLSTVLVDIPCRAVLCKGNIPMSVALVTGVKINSEDAALHLAVERLLGKTRVEIAQLARSVIEARLRSLLSSLEPDQVYGDRIEIADRLSREIAPDLAQWGLTIDALKVSDIVDESGYLAASARKRQADRVCEIRIEEATLRTDAAIRAAHNLETEVKSSVDSQLETLIAETARRSREIELKRDAAVAEQVAAGKAHVAVSMAEVDVQRARADLMKVRLQTEIIVPAKAAAMASESQARAAAASITQAGVAKAEALRSLAESWKNAGEHATEAMMMQKMEGIVSAVAAAMGRGSDEPGRAVVDYARLARPIGSEEPLMAHNEQSLSIGYPKSDK